MTKLERGEEQDVQLILHMLKYVLPCRSNTFVFSITEAEHMVICYILAMVTSARVDHPINHDIVVYYVTVQVHMWILNFN